jgi:hypothetical protein
MVENDPLIIVRKAKAMIIASSGISDSQDLVRAALKALGYSRKKRVLVHTRSWSIEIATIVFLERCDLHEAQERRLFFFQSIILSSDETVEAYTGIRRDGVLCTYNELEESTDIIICSNFGRCICRPQFLS